MRTKKKLYPPRFHEQTIRICRCTHEEGKHDYNSLAMNIYTWKTSTPCFVCICPDYTHMRTKTERFTL